MIISRRIENFDSVIRGEIENGAAEEKRRRKKSRGREGRFTQGKLHFLRGIADECKYQRWGR